MRGPETRLRLKIRDELQRLWPKAWIRKIHGNRFQHVGIMDYLCCFEGFFIGLEVKIPNGKATPAQLNEGRLLERAGGYFAIVTSREEAVDAVREGIKRGRSRRSNSDRT
jgi:hypothetical protein